MAQRLSRADLFALASLAVTVAIIGSALYALAVDDAFITYRYAYNLAHQLGYVYNPGQAILSTTAPFYGLLLAAFAWLGFDVAVASNVISVMSIGAGGMLLYSIARKRGRRWLGWIAGMLYVLNPLLWLSLGMETDFHLALVLAAFAADEFARSGLAGLALGVAFITRYDAALPAAILFLRRLPLAARAALKMAVVASIVALPVLAYLTLTYGSPLPATLAAKRAQSVLGVSGFFPGSNVIQGLVILLQGWFEQSWLYVVLLLAVLRGLALAIWRERWVLPYVLWACAQVIGYVLLGSAPYYWYYAPLVPAVVWVGSLGVEWQSCKIGRNRRVIARSTPAEPLVPPGPRKTRARNDVSGPTSNLQRPTSNLQLLASTFLILLAFAPLVYSLFSIWQAQTGPLPQVTSNQSKVLPEAKTSVYRRVGKWVAAHTPSASTLGATEIGVIGYYAQRELVDFLGLLQPNVATAIGAGDPRWALYAYQPDYVALDAINPIYTFDPRSDDWFRAAYTPVQRFDDERFWASPVIIYRRDVPRFMQASVESVPANVPSMDAIFGDSIQLLAAASSTDSLAPGQPLAVRLWWRALAPVERDYALSVQSLGEDDLIVAQSENLAGTTIHPTSKWSAGEIVGDLALIGVPRTACAPDIAQLNIVLYDAKTGARLRVTDAQHNDLGDSLRLGRLTMAARGADSSSGLGISFGRALTLDDLSITPRAVRPGGSLTLTQTWREDKEWQEGLVVFVHLVADDNRIVAQADGPAVLEGEDRRTIQLPKGTDAGVYRVVIGVYRREGGGRLPWLDAVGQPLGDSLPLCRVRVR